MTLLPEDPQTRPGVPGEGAVAVEDPEISGPTAAVAEPEVDAAPKKRLGLGAWLAIIWLGLLVGSAVLAPYLPLKDPAVSAGTTAKLSPFQDMSLPFGTDASQRDQLARLIWGARNSLIISIGAIVAAFLIGGLLGLIAGFYRTLIGRALAALFDILLAIPALVLVLSLVAVLKGDPTDQSALPAQLILIIAIGLVSIPLVARITRAQTLSWAQRDFVLAARAQGAGSGRILFREILPNVLPAMAYIALLGVGIAMIAEGAAAIFGASVNPPASTFGVLINDGRVEIDNAPFLLFEPILFIFLTVMSLNFLGDVVRDRFDVRESAL